MASKPKTFGIFRYSRIKDETYTVCLEGPDGTSVVGTVRHFFVRHLNQWGWEATGSDGHRGVHEQREQAAKALTWDGKGYPFPYFKESV